MRLEAEKEGSNHLIQALQPNEVTKIVTCFNHSS